MAGRDPATVITAAALGALGLYAAHAAQEFLLSATGGANHRAEEHEADGGRLSHRELAGMKVMELRQRALGAGVSGDAVEDALESEAPKRALAALLRRAAAAASTREWAARADLRGLKLMELMARALSLGITRAVAEESMEASDPKSALIELILRAETGREQPEPEPAQDPDEALRRVELQCWRLTQLRQRARGSDGC
jgi:hypothetical protein